MNQAHDIGLTVIELRAWRSTLDSLDIPTKAEIQPLGVRFAASNAVPPGERWVNALTADGNRATLVHDVAAYDTSGR